jgi:hypothetical protein
VATEEICQAHEILACLQDKDRAGPCVESEVQRTLKRLSSFSQSAILDMIDNLERILRFGSVCWQAVALPHLECLVETNQQ